MFKAWLLGAAKPKPIESLSDNQDEDDHCEDAYNKDAHDKDNHKKDDQKHVTFCCEIYCRLLDFFGICDLITVVKQIHFASLFFHCVWGCWKHPFGIPGARPMFLKLELHKESKYGFKTINCHCYPVLFFSKKCFWCKKIIKTIGRFVDFWIFLSI